MTTIKLKNGSGAPTSGDLAQGEPALDLTNKRLYTEDSGGTVIEVGTNPTSITTGTLTADGGTIVSTGSDAFSSKAVGGYAIQAYQDATSSGHTALDLRSDATTSTRYLIRGYNDAAGTPTEVFSVGADGTVTADGLTVDGSTLFLDGVFTTGSTPTINLGDSSTYFKVTYGSNAAIGGYTGVDIFGTASGNKIATFANGGDISFYEDTGTTAKFFWDASAERLGIGTSSPSNPLHVATASTDVAKFATTGAYNFISLDNATRNWALSVGSTFSIYDATAASTRMSIDASGNLLVGTTNVNPAANNVTGHAIKAGGLVEHANSGAMVMRLNRTDSSGSIIEFRQGTSAVGSIGASGGDLIIGTGDTGLYFWDGDDSVIPWNIDTNSSRDDGIDLGNANHRFKDLHLSGTVLVGTTLTNPTTGSDEGIALGATGIMLASNANDAALAVNRVGSNGDVVIYKRQGVQVGSVSVSGTNATFNTSSDQRLKDNIVDAPSASDDIDAIQVRSFDWKTDGSHQKYGMVAQELQSVAPEAVSEGATEEDMMGVDYSKLVPMMLKEIQSLRARVAQLETN